LSRLNKLVASPPRLGYEYFGRREKAVSANSLAARLRGLVASYVKTGVSRVDGKRRRGREIVNFVALATVVSNTGFAILFSLLDFRGFLPFVLTLLFFSLVWLATPLLHRFGELTAGTYLWATAMAGDAAYAWIAGTDAGFQYFLLAGPATLVMVLGSRRLKLVAFYFSILLLVFALIELTFPAKSAYIAMSEGMTTFSFLLSVCMSAAFNLLAALYTFRRAEEYEDAFEAEHERSEKLLLNLMPASIAERLKHDPDGLIADDLPSVTILFADIVGFTARAAALPAGRLVRFLNRIFLEFDRLAEEHGLEKIKTIGDAYMVAGGMPEPRPDHAGAVAAMALDMLDVMRKVSEEYGEDVAVRIGIHSGPAVAGVIGERKQFYDVWGDTVNVAARMESHGEPGWIQVSAAARQAIGPAFGFVERGVVEVKGKGPMELFFLAPRTDGFAVPPAGPPAFAS
jgi:adenylate cyclase